MDITLLIRTGIQVSILLLVFGLGLRATPEDALYLLRRPALMARSFMAMNVVVPLFAATLAGLFDLRPPVEVALVLLAVSPVPPILPGKQLRLGGRTEYVYGLLVAMSLFAIVFVPSAIKLLGMVFRREAYIEPAAIAKVVLITVLVPLFVGLMLRRVVPAVAESIAPWVSRFGNVLLLVGALPILVTAWRGIVSLVGNGTILAISAVIIAGLAAGHLLGGPEPGDRTTLAIASSMRHPGVALTIASVNFPGQKEVPAAVLLFILVNAIVTLLYATWCRRRSRQDPRGE
jgi:BASS family bile acid:Na+ symporter